MLLPSDLMGEVVAALGAAFGDEPRVWTARIWAGQPARMRCGANIAIDGAVGQIEQGPVGVPSPYLPNLAGTIEERTVAAVGGSGRLLKHHFTWWGSTPPRPTLLG